MTASLARFTQLLRRAESAASCFDGSGLAAASQELTGCVEALLQTPLAKDQVAELHQALCSYRDLCAFLQDTLHQTLLHAAGGAEPAGYSAAQSTYGAGGRCPEVVVPTHLQPLLRRYA